MNDRDGDDATRSSGPPQAIKKLGGAALAAARAAMTKPADRLTNRLNERAEELREASHPNERPPATGRAEQDTKAGPDAETGADAGTAQDAGQPGKDTAQAGNDTAQAGKDTAQAGEDTAQAGKDTGEPSEDAGPPSEESAAGPDGGHMRTGEHPSKSLKYSQEISSPDQEPERQGRSLVTTHHEVIQNWAEARAATPATVGGTEHGEHLGVLRLDFGGNNENLRHVSWQEWFDTFDLRRLNFIYQEKRSDGHRSNFFRLENPDTDDT